MQSNAVAELRIVKNDIASVHVFEICSDVQSLEVVQRVVGQVRWDDVLQSREYRLGTSRVAAVPIGHHFPDTDPRYKGADSRVLLRGAVALLRERGWAPVNVDATLIAQQPKLAPHAAAMVANVAADLGIGLDCVNIKGKTNEKLGYLGREEAIEAQAVVLVEKIG